MDQLYEHRLVVVSIPRHHAAKALVQQGSLTVKKAAAFGTLDVADD
jgi:hypothetical protein